MGFTRHRLNHINAEREQDRPEEDGHHNRGRNDVVMEDIQPAWQLEIFYALLFLTQIRRDFVSNPGGELLLVTDGKTTAVGHFLGRLVHHIGGNAPVERHQHRGTDDGGPHRVTKDVERDSNQPRLLEHDVPSQHDGSNAGNTP